MLWCSVFHSGDTTMVSVFEQYSQSPEVTYHWSKQSNILFESKFCCAIWVFDSWQLTGAPFGFDQILTLLWALQQQHREVNGLRQWAGNDLKHRNRTAGTVICVCCWRLSFVTVGKKKRWKTEQPPAASSPPFRRHLACPDGKQERNGVGSTAASLHAVS